MWKQYWGEDAWVWVDKRRPTGTILFTILYVTRGSTWLRYVKNMRTQRAALFGSRQSKHRAAHCLLAQWERGRNSQRECLRETLIVQLILRVSTTKNDYARRLSDAPYDLTVEYRQIYQPYCSIQTKKRSLSFNRQRKRALRPNDTDGKVTNVSLTCASCWFFCRLPFAAERRHGIKPPQCRHRGQLSK